MEKELIIKTTSNIKDETLTTPCKNALKRILH